LIPEAMPRPRTNIQWEPASVRFTESENKKLAQVVRASGLSKAEFIRRATMAQVNQALKSGRLVVAVR
jgi:hypothetical protein